jgi:hypothetical protein
MTPRIPENFSTWLVGLNLVTVMGDTPPPRNPNDDDDDEEEEEEDEDEDEDDDKQNDDREPAVIREPDEDE